VLASIRAENRAYHYGDRETEQYSRAKSELLECFCPANPKWRLKAVESGLDIIDTAGNGL